MSERGGFTKIIAIDGHDGAGKSTLSRLCADRLGGQYLRPFGGVWGKRLMDAHHSSDYNLILKVGEEALKSSILEANQNGLLVLDRSWITVNTLIPSDIFNNRWKLWIPTILCWSDLGVTLQRLKTRDFEKQENAEHHKYYLSRYLECAASKGCTVIRTDLSDVEESFLSIKSSIDISGKVP